MKREEIIKITTEVLVEEFEVEPSVIQDEADFRESLALDSLDYVDLVVVIESHFGVKLVEADFKEIVTFNDFYTTIENKIINCLNFNFSIFPPKQQLLYHKLSY